LNEIPQVEESKSKFRLIFLNLLISFFIIISYVNIAEISGSISTLYILNNDLILRFGFTLTIFTFLSVVAGPVHGLVDGFIAELLYQIAFYHEIYIEWCVIVAILGFLVGLYKYKPLKYHKGTKVYYTFLQLVISSFIIMGFIILLQFLFYPNQFTAEIIIINFGIKFLIQALVSIIFVIPILLILYDKAFASTEKQLYYLWFTHHPISASDHTFHLKFGRTKIYFCSRCSGVVIGGLFAFFTTKTLEKIFQAQISAEIALFLIIIMPIPNFIDWGTQRLLMRKSTTASRLFTGFIIGVALHIMSFTYKYYFYTMLILSIYFFILFLLVYFGHKKEKRLYQEEEKRFYSSIDDE
jgi:uncharacterized membrane protein